MAKNMKVLDIASWILCTIGALVLGAVGAFNYNVVDALLGGIAAKIAYIVIGLGGLFSLAHMLKFAKK